MIRYTKDWIYEDHAEAFRQMKCYTEERREFIGRLHQLGKVITTIYFAEDKLVYLLTTHFGSYFIIVETGQVNWKRHQSGIEGSFHVADFSNHILTHYVDDHSELVTELTRLANKAMPVLHIQSDGKFSYEVESLDGCRLEAYEMIPGTYAVYYCSGANLYLGDYDGCVEFFKNVSDLSKLKQS